MVASIAGVVLAAPPMGQTLAQGDADDPNAGKYQAPQSGGDFFNVDKLQMPDGMMAWILATLTDVAVLPDSSLLTKSRALGIALHLDPVYRPAFSANMLLQQGRSPLRTRSSTTLGCCGFL